MDNEKKIEKEIGITKESEATNETVDEEDDSILKLKKPYIFEGKTYTEIDMSTLADMTVADLKAVARFAGKTSSGDLAPEVSLTFAIALASRKTGLPVEFFDGLPGYEGMRIKNRVMGFLFGLE